MSFDGLQDEWAGSDLFAEGGIRVLRPRRVSGVWTTRAGVQVKFSEMEHSHLLNTIAYVERQYRGLQDTFDEGALDIDLLYPEHAGLVAEARRRKLIPRRSKSTLVTA